MNCFDPKTKFLILSDKKLDTVTDRYKDSDQFISYKKYLYGNGLRDDIKNVLLPALNELFSKDGIELSFIDDKSMNIQLDANFAGQNLYKIMLSLVLKDAINFNDPNDVKKGFYYKDKLLNPFVLMEFPYMDRSGALYRNGKIYSVLNSLVLGDAVTFDGSKLKYVDSDHSFELDKPNKPTVKMFKDNITMIDLIVAMFKHDYGMENGIEFSKDCILSFRDVRIIKSIAGTEKDYRDFGSDVFGINLEVLTSLKNDNISYEFRLEDKIKAGLFSSLSTRSYLNEIFSFKNAIGRTISRDIVASDGKIIAKRGEVVSNTLIKELHRNLVDTIYVTKKLNMVGLYLAETIYLGKSLIKGTPIIPQMVEIIPELESYTVVPKNYDIPDDVVLMIPAGTVLTEEICNYFSYIDKRTVKYKEKITSPKILTAYFEEEYINNRHFPMEDVSGVVDCSEYGNCDCVFVDLNGVVKGPSDVITSHDLAALLSMYLKITNGYHIDLVSDPDIGLRKTVNQCYNHFHKSFVHAVEVFIKSKGYELSKIVDSNGENMNNSDKMNAIFKKFSSIFFGYMRSTLRVLDMVDFTNPVATVSSLTKVNTIVKNAESIPDSLRRLTMGHYGRICPYEMPQSKKLGVVNNLACMCRVEDGIMRTPYFKLIHSSGKIFIDKEPVYLTVQEEEKYRIADIGRLDYDESTREVLTSSKVLARIPSFNALEKVTVADIDIEYVQYVSVSPNQHESLACTTVPYAGADDAIRVSFGLSMAKQSKSLVRGEIPIVCTTGFLNIPNLSTYYKIFSEGFGIVRVVNSSSVTVIYNGNPEPVTYRFNPMHVSTNSIILMVPEVQVGDRVKPGQTLVTSNFVQDGIMTTGVNALVAYMTDGYNYEDGATCSERISRKLTSYGIHSDTFSISKKTLSASAEKVAYDDYISKDDVLFVKKERTSNASEYFYSRMPAKECRGFIANYELVRDPIKYNRVKDIVVRSVSFDVISKSDKICNRHGNKGVDCMVHKNSEMPYLENGEFMDVLYNPNGIASRMNEGQVLEASSGLACYVLGIRLLCDSFNSPSTENIKILLSYAVDLANESDEELVFSKYPMLPKELHDHCRKNILSIRRWKGVFDKEGKAYLIDPVSGKRSYNKVNIGVNYIYKLVQEGEDKLHSRGGFMTSRYVDKTESPTKGASKGGGQRVGHMELDGYSAHGVAALLSEMTNWRSDNYVERNNQTVKVVHSGVEDFVIHANGIRRSSEYMFETLKALGLKVESDSRDLDLSHPEDRKYYKRSAIQDADFEDIKKEQEDFSFDLFKELRDLKNRRV